MDDKTGGWRGSAELWLTAAERALCAGGVQAVRVGPLAAGLGLSRTSFYGHFDSREALLAALVQKWEAKNTGNLVARCAAYAETLPEAIFNLFDCWVDPGLFDPELDMAVRAWALADPALRPRTEAADAARIGAIAGLFRRFGIEAEEAEVRACTLYYTQIGYFALRVRESLSHRIARMPQYVRTFSGLDPAPAEIARFRARHGAGT